MTATLQSAHSSTPIVATEGGDPLVIALVNNMPDAALQTTERQFTDLLRAAGAAFDVRLRLFSFPELVRGEAGRAYVAEHYEPIDRLWQGEFDGLIVTGAEPRTSRLPDEVYWASLTRLVDLAASFGIDTVWSCLAAHAAVLHLSGVERRRLAQKISGVFECAKTREHPLTAGLPSSWRIPHSRLNTLEADALDAAGYRLLSHSDATGPDTFLLRRNALFVFFQGHPEYDVGALLREYRRDVGRFLSGTMEQYPEMPHGYFDNHLTEVFEEFRARAHHQRTRDLLAEFPCADGQEKLTGRWHDAAVALYASWLGAIRPRTVHGASQISAAALRPARAV